MSARRSRPLWTTVFSVLAALALILVVQAQAARPLNVSQSVKQGQTLSGQIAWTASVSGPKSSSITVTFAVDGVVRSTDSSNPYAYNGGGTFDTSTLSDGSHTFTVTARTSSGTATNTATATVQNTPAPPPPTFTVSESLPTWSSLAGTIPWTATPSISSSSVAHVDFLVDSQVVLSDTTAPYGDTPGFFDTTKVANGSHSFSVKAYAVDGQTATSTSTSTVLNGTATPQPTFPIYAAFYYPWYPETWSVNGQFLKYHPSLGYYSTTNLAVQQAHVRALQYAGMKAAISSWWGPGHYSDTRLKQLMQTTVGMGSSLKWAVYYENEGYGDPTVDKLASDLAYIRDNLATSSAYLKINGRFVVFVYSAGDKTCALADRWAQANSLIGNAAYVDLKVFLGYGSCANQPASWHQYGPAWAEDKQPGYSITISPGFWACDEATPRLARDPARWASNVADLVSNTAPWRLVTTFNEWCEGTAAESAQEWASPSGYGVYLDTLHNAILGP
jgi:hypothetical protein